MVTKKKVLLLSDDLRMFSGVAVMSKEFVVGTIHKFDWVQIGGAIKHPDQGKVFDLSQSLKEERGIEGAYLKIYPTSGYGNSDMLRQIMQIEKPDAILHFTDPRFWLWLYQMEHEIRQNIPIYFYNIWDDLPDPMYNRNFYRCCDLLMAISRQTHGINNRVVPEYKDWQLQYVPHGINGKKFFKIDKGDTKFKEFEKKYTLEKYKFKVLYLNRNIRRKQPGDVVIAYKHFMDQLSKEQRKDCALVFHTAPSDPNGTDLRAVCQTLIPDYNVVFTHDYGERFDDEQMNFVYNSCDVYINAASNEGFGLGSAEALSTETPIIVNVTGGLQDQCGFKKENGEYLIANDYIELGSNHRGRYKDHGEWCTPVFPSNISLQGSPPTPYIFDDRANAEDFGEAIKHWYDMGAKDRERCGKLGKEFLTVAGLTAEEMSQRFIESMGVAFENFTPRERYSVEVV